MLAGLSASRVAGEAACYFDPLSVPDIAAALGDVISDRGLASHLSEMGIGQEARFTWQATAEGTLESYARAWSASRRKERQARPTR